MAALKHPRIVTKKPCNLLEERVALRLKKGSRNSSASSDEHLPKQYLQKRLRVAT